MNIVDHETKMFLKGNNSINVLKVIDFLENHKALQANATIEELATADFFKIYFSCSLHRRCSFSIWIERSDDQIVFFNVGEKEIEATVFHYIEISSLKDVEQVISGIKTFLESVVEKQSQYCNGRLKKVSYKLIHANHKGLIYTKLVESHLFCFRKSLSYDKYEAWTK
ncbi:hypothetical protein [Flavisolibacter nicotianae]|uniref:hypothetical protein n=1 Tax=Flavisolibacter nicotianae TaxID=2364882 RepID=UPI000EAD2597|nr:hypothetical protein [Flavisolibacter nicotianae]